MLPILPYGGRHRDASKCVGPVSTLLACRVPEFWAGKSCPHAERIDQPNPPILHTALINKSSSGLARRFATRLMHSIGSVSCTSEACTEDEGDLRQTIEPGDRKMRRKADEENWKKKRRPDPKDAERAIRWHQLLLYLRGVSKFQVAYAQYLRRYTRGLGMNQTGSTLC